MELLLETTKGKIAISATFPFLFNCGLLSTFAQRVGWSTVNCQLTSFMQLVVPRAVSAAVRMDTTTWMMFRHRSLFFIMISRPSLSFGHLPRGGGEPSGL